MHPSPRGGRTWKLPGFPARSSGGSDDTWYGATTGCSVITDSNWNARDLPTEKGCLSARMKKKTWLSTVGCLEVQHYDVAPYHAEVDWQTSSNGDCDGHSNM